MLRTYKSKLPNIEIINFVDVNDTDRVKKKETTINLSYGSLFDSISSNGKCEMILKKVFDDNSCVLKSSHMLSPLEYLL